MQRIESLEKASERLGPSCQSFTQPSHRRLYLSVAPDRIRSVSRTLYNDCSARLQTASGVDGPEQIEILYHWANDQDGWIATVRTSISRSSPLIESITEECPAAHWIERELWELLGIQFQGHPDLRHLLLTDDWPEGEYPLRRDYRKG